jgi:hypothetical protein
MKSESHMLERQSNSQTYAPAAQNQTVGQQETVETKGAASGSL